MVGQLKSVSNSPHRLKGVPAWGTGHILGCRGRAFLRTACRIFRGGTKGRERDGSRQSGEEQAWENRGKRRQVEPVTHKRLAGQCTCLACPCTRPAPPVLLSHQTPFLTLFLCEEVSMLCAHVCVGAPHVTDWGETRGQRPTCPWCSTRSEHGCASAAVGAGEDGARPAVK